MEGGRVGGREGEREMEGGRGREGVINHQDTNVQCTCKARQSKWKHSRQTCEKS